MHDAPPPVERRDQQDSQLPTDRTATERLLPVADVAIDRCHELAVGAQTGSRVA
jgi:hypothetical protein